MEVDDWTADFKAQLIKESKAIRPANRRAGPAECPVAEPAGPVAAMPPQLQVLSD